MTNPTKDRVVRSGAIGVFAMLLWLGRSYYRDPCLFEWDGVGSELILPGLFGILVFAFAWLKPWGRVVLVLSLVGGWWVVPSGIHGHERGLAPQSAAVANLRTIAAHAHAQRTDQGFPDSIPLDPFQQNSKHYQLRYERGKSGSPGSVDSFQVYADPLHEGCRLRHFLMTGDGIIHHTMEPRAATITDPAI